MDAISRLVREDDLPAFAEAYAKTLSRGDVVLLIGGLGAGKTSFVRHIAFALKASEIVSSPTFALMHEYHAALNGEEIVIRHLDLYRLPSAESLYDIGLSEIANDDALTFVEWGDTYREYFPSPRTEITIDIVDDDTRRFTIKKIERVG